MPVQRLKVDYDNVYMGGYLYAYFEYKKVFIDANVSITYQESEGDDFNTTDIEVRKRFDTLYALF